MKTKRLIEVLIVIWILIMILLLTACFEISTGSRAGNLIKFSKKGIVCKTYEGTLLLGGQGNGTINSWDFSVENEVLAKELESKIGKNIVLNYSQEFVTSPCRSSTNYFVISEKL